MYKFIRQVRWASLVLMIAGLITHIQALHDIGLFAMLLSIVIPYFSFEAALFAYYEKEKQNREKSSQDVPSDNKDA